MRKIHTVVHDDCWKCCHCCFRLDEEDFERDFENGVNATTIADHHDGQ